VIVEGFSLALEVEEEELLPKALALYEKVKAASDRFDLLTLSDVCFGTWVPEPRTKSAGLGEAVIGSEKALGERVNVGKRGVVVVVEAFDWVVGVAGTDCFGKKGDFRMPSKGWGASSWREISDNVLMAFPKVALVVAELEVRMVEADGFRSTEFSEWSDAKELLWFGEIDDVAKLVDVLNPELGGKDVDWDVEEPSDEVARTSADLVFATDSSAHFLLWF
jgi:hypothetical protein